MVESGFADAEMFVVMAVPEIEFGVGEGLDDAAMGEGGFKLGEVEVHGETLYEPPVVSREMLFTAHLRGKTVAFTPAHDDGAGVVTDQRAFAGGEREVESG